MSNDDWSLVKGLMNIIGLRDIDANAIGPQRVDAVIDKRHGQATKSMDHQLPYDLPSVGHEKWGRYSNKKCQMKQVIMDQDDDHCCSWKFFFHLWYPANQLSLHFKFKLSIPSQVINAKSLFMKKTKFNLLGEHISHSGAKQYHKLKHESEKFGTSQLFKKYPHNDSNHQSENSYCLAENA